uniref:Uncharacterized protein n=1 Tax=Knipowitschia caucasica TaxID=637954 RepID=A0AAV2KBK1_KNICA
MALLTAEGSVATDHTDPQEKEASAKCMRTGQKKDKSRVCGGLLCCCSSGPRIHGARVKCEREPCVLLRELEAQS